MQKIAMTKRPDKAPGDAPGHRSRRARLHALLFAGTALGTTILAMLGGDAVKLPTYTGE